MKFILFLVKYICLLVLILLLAEVVKCGCQSGCLDIVRHLTEGGLAESVTTPWFALMAGLLLLMGLLRGVTAIWNIIFCWSIVLLIFLIILVSFGTDVALPGAAAVLTAETNVIIAGLDQLSQLIGAHITSIPNCEFLLLLVPTGLILGGLFSNSRLRIAFYSVVGYALWYGLSKLFLYLLVLWGRSETPLLAEVQVFLSDSDWVIPTLMGVFFTIYVTILAFYETYSPRRSEGEASTKEARNDVLTEREMPESLTEAVLNPSAVNMVPDEDPTVPLHPGAPPIPPAVLIPPAVPVPQVLAPDAVDSAHPSTDLPPTAAARATAEQREASRVTPQPIPPTQASRADASELTTAAAALSREATSGDPEALGASKAEDQNDGQGMIDAALSSLPAEDSKTTGTAADQAPTVPLPPTETFDEIREALSDMREAREEAEALAEQQGDETPVAEPSDSAQEPSLPTEATGDHAPATSPEAPPAPVRHNAEQQESKPTASSQSPTAPATLVAPAPLPVPPLPPAPETPVTPQPGTDGNTTQPPAPNAPDAPQQRSIERDS